MLALQRSSYSKYGGLRWNISGDLSIKGARNVIRFTVTSEVESSRKHEKKRWIISIDSSYQRDRTNEISEMVMLALQVQLP
eukprot:CCRYP_012555-RA/>CCRYP_012555-RA protein AED:0.47 eAED:0.79 QI:0/0/0/1/0/0/3/0/80